jgi:hypothetical protein
MIATIAGTPTPGITAIITKLRCSTDSKRSVQKSKKGNLAAPLFAS